MGLWSFAKSAGKKLFGVGAAEAATPDPEALKAEIADLGLDATGVEIKVEGDKVVVEGNAVSAEMKEKIILAVGNVEGVAEVEAEDDDVAPVFHTATRCRPLPRRLWAMPTATPRFSRPTARC